MKDTLQLGIVNNRIIWRWSLPYLKGFLFRCYFVWLFHFNRNNYNFRALKITSFIIYRQWFVINVDTNISLNFTHFRFIWPQYLTRQKNWCVDMLIYWYILVFGEISITQSLNHLFIHSTYIYMWIWLKSMKLPKCVHFVFTSPWRNPLEKRCNRYIYYSR